MVAGSLASAARRSTTASSHSRHCHCILERREGGFTRETLSEFVVVAKVFLVHQKTAEVVSRIEQLLISLEPLSRDFMQVHHALIRETKLDESAFTHIST